MKKITNLVASVSALLLITSCSHEADFDSTAYVQQKKNEYAQNFVKKYGEIDPNQTWDFTSGATLGATTRAGETSEVYVCKGLDFGLEETVTPKWGGGYTYSYNVTNNKDIYNTIKDKLIDGDTHTGQKAVLVAPGNPFVIYPLTVQGMYTHKLYVKVGNTSYLLYDKNWTIYDRPFCNGMLIGYNFWGQPVRANMKGIYVDVPAGTRIEVYLVQLERISTRESEEQVASARNLCGEICIEAVRDATGLAVAEIQRVEERTHREASAFVAAKVRTNATQHVFVYRFPYVFCRAVDSPSAVVAVGRRGALQYLRGHAQRVDGRGRRGARSENCTWSYSPLKRHQST